MQCRLSRGLLSVAMLTATLIFGVEATAEQSEETIYTVLGDVQSPGQFSSPQPLTIRDAAVSAQPTTDSLRITVLRGGQNRNQWTTMVNLRGPNNSENVTEGDILLVEAVGRAGQISENAAIRTRTGVTVISLMDEQVSVGDVLVGMGLSPQNSPRVDIVTRLRGNRPQKNVAADTPVLHGDIMVLEGSESSSAVPFVTGPGRGLKVSVSEWGNSSRSGRLGAGSVRGSTAAPLPYRDEYDDRTGPVRDSYGRDPGYREPDSYGYAGQGNPNDAYRGEFDRPRYAEDYRPISERNDAPAAPPWTERPGDYYAGDYPPQRREIPPEYRMPRDDYRQEQSWDRGYADERNRGDSVGGRDYPGYRDSRYEGNAGGMSGRGSFVSSSDQDYPPVPGSGGYGPQTGVPAPPQPLFPGAVPMIPNLRGTPADEDSLLKDPLPAFPNLPSEPLRQPRPQGGPELNSFSGAAIPGELNTIPQPPVSQPVPQMEVAESVSAEPLSAGVSGAEPVQAPLAEQSPLAVQSQKAESAGAETGAEGAVPPPVAVASAAESERTTDAVDAASAGVLNTMVILAFLVTGGWLMIRAFSSSEPAPAGTAAAVSAPEPAVPVSRPVPRKPVAVVEEAVVQEAAAVNLMAQSPQPEVRQMAPVSEPMAPVSEPTMPYVPFSETMRAIQQPLPAASVPVGFPEQLRQVPPRSMAADLAGAAGTPGLERDVLERLLANQIPRQEQTVRLPDGVRIYGRPGHPEFARVDAEHGDLSGPRHAAAFGVESQRRQQLDQRLERLVRSVRRSG